MMTNGIDLLGIASWLGILVVAIQYYVTNFVKPERWEQFDKEPDPIKRENLRKSFKKKWDFIIFPLLAIAVMLGLSGIVIQLIN